MDNQDNPTASQTAPEGYEAREVVWPGTDERFMALFPKFDGTSSFDV